MNEDKKYYQLYGRAYRVGFEYGQMLHEAFFNPNVQLIRVLNEYTLINLN